MQRDGNCIMRYDCTNAVAYYYLVSEDQMTDKELVCALNDKNIPRYQLQRFM